MHLSCSLSVVVTRLILKMLCNPGLRSHFVPVVDHNSITQVSKCNE
uniref:Uncharacterized protein n=1 Tax=uncultured Chloroflexi bacterium HF0200_09I09 TaxID=710736 RepID=E0XU93_9CHLR|nr:hypothetical protein [uncultured Chloroflexi bacterium HF0200_09I09]